MKKVFNSNSQLAHVWAQQSQGEGRTENMFFEGDEIYSYGRHYLAAKIHRGFVLVNSNTYSISTSKHLSEIRNALRGLVDYFKVPNVSNPKAQENIDFILNEIEQVYVRYEKMMKVTGSDEYEEYFLPQLNNLLDECNDFFNYIQINKTIVIDTERAIDIKNHLAFRFKRYQELNTSEIIAAKKAKKQAKLELELAESIANFRIGKSVNLSGLEYDLIRIQKDEVVTSRGARVPLSAAKLMLANIVSAEALPGDKVGEFTLQTYNTDTIKIGCHTIQLKEAIAVLGEK